METMTTPEVKPIDSLKEFVKQSTTPAIEPKPEQISTGNTSLSDNDFLSTGKHTTEQGFSMGDNAKTPITGGNGLNTNTGSNVRPMGTMIPNAGKFACSLQDFVFPALIVWATRSYGYDAKKGDLKLTKEDKDVLVPAWDAYLMSVNINFDKPIYQLMIAIGLTYGSKFLDDEMNFKFKKIVKTAKQPGVPSDIKVTAENYNEVFDLEREKMIKETRGKIRKSRDVVIKVLTEQGEFKRLDKELRLRHGIKTA